MCGIAGILHLNGDTVSPVNLQRMTDAISHRGPDGEGQWIEGNIGLGHRRLSIIDLSNAGHQPIMSSDQRYVLSYNGEIYNFKELRKELEVLGYHFRSQTDSEVVLNALAEWGTDALLKFNGMFAFALWDRKRRKLLLARDRYGIKPLYYSQQGNNFSFASEQKAILTLAGFKRSVNKEALLEYFTFQNFLTNQTLINKISILQPGHFLSLDLLNTKNPSRELTEYWDYSFQSSPEKIDAFEYRDELSRLFKQAVNRQLVSDVELGVYLSGGMDSGSIASISAGYLPNIKSFTCGFDLSSASGIELGFDERVKAEAMSAAFGTEHYEMILKAGDMERCLADLTWHLEEPRVGQSYPNFYASKLASRFVKVVLSGVGGDELFGGYPWRYFRLSDANTHTEFVDSYYRYWQRLVSNSEMKDLFKPIWNDVSSVWTRDIFEGILKKHDFDVTDKNYSINRSLYFEAKTFLHGLLVVEDKLSMAHSLETRVPFLDNDLVDFAMKCPVELKIKNFDNIQRIDENEPAGKKTRYFQKTNDGKQILRHVMSQYLPKEITKAEKQGFSAPDASWFRGRSIDFVRSRLLNQNAPLYEYLDYPSCERMLKEHFSGKRNRRLFIWSLLNVNQFLKEYF